MDPGFRSPLIDFFRRGEVARDVRLLAADGALAPRAHDQIALLVMLSDDPDPEVARTAAETIRKLPEVPLRAFLGRSEVPPEIRAFFAARGIEPSAPPAGAAAEEQDQAGQDPLLDTLTELPQAEGGEAGAPEHKLLSSLSVLERMKLAMKGTREQRSALIRDSNKLVSAAVLSSPKLTESEVEAFAKMGNVSEEVLRVIGMNRSWVKNYGVALGLCRNPKTPPGMSMSLIHRINERDVKMIATDRNVPEALRLLARKLSSKGHSN
ncbi:MAG TPA: hypothetical protein VFX12_01430 [Vicinamibacterales bacterium]|nr:hypothetical protein [Vicinamibacterales bacterium]